MKRDQKLVIGGYTVPGGVGRVAVAAAVDLIKRYPGVKQADVQRHAVRFSGLHDSTAGWVTTPGPKGPSGHLWNRRKEDVFRCYPNENTALFNLDPVELAKEIVKRSFAEILHKPGELVEVEDYRGKKICMLIGFKLSGSYEFMQIHKGTYLLETFRDLSLLDDPKVWGFGIPTFNCVVNADGGIADFPPTLVRALPAAA